MSEQLKRQNIFKPVLDRFHDEVTNDFDEEAYNKFMDEMYHYGVSDFLDFLHHTHCTYSAVNKFLVECLHQAQEHGWDT